MTGRRTIRIVEKALDWLGFIAIIAVAVLVLIVMTKTIKRGWGQEVNQPLVQLGRTLFWDSRLSDDNTTSCASCHDFARYGGTDGRMIAVGKINGVDQNGNRVGPTGLIGIRRSPPILNVTQTKYLSTKRMFLDHRATSPLNQATQPIENPIEMGNQTVEQVARRLNRYKGYQRLVLAAYPGTRSILTKRRIAEALVAFEKEFTALDTPLNRYFQQDETHGLGASAMRGATVFKRECIGCHKPPLFTNGECYNTGIELRFARTLTAIAASRGDARDSDIGLAKTTGRRADVRKFKTPGLVGLVFRKHFMHNGVLTSVNKVIEHYASGARFRYNGDDVIRLDPLTDDRVKNMRGKFTEQDKRDLSAVLMEGLIPNDYPSQEEIGPPEKFP